MLWEVQLLCQGERPLLSCGKGSPPEPSSPTISHNIQIEVEPPWTATPQSQINAAPWDAKQKQQLNILAKPTQPKEFWEIHSFYCCIIKRDPKRKCHHWLPQKLQHRRGAKKLCEGCALAWLQAGLIVFSHHRLSPIQWQQSAWRKKYLALVSTGSHLNSRESGHLTFSSMDIFSGLIKSWKNHWFLIPYAVGIHQRLLRHRFKPIESLY